MTIQTSQLQREFRFKHNGNNIVLTDPDPETTPERVMKLYENQYPALTTATVSGPEFKDDKAVYEFKTTIGTKG